MGILCCKKNSQSLEQSNDTNKALVPTHPSKTEKEISIQTYSSQSDKDLSPVESKYNILKDIEFYNFAYSLANFSIDTASLTDDYSKDTGTYNISDFNTEFSADLFQTFLENKILKHPSVYSKAGEDEILSSTFKDAFLNIIKSLNQKLSQSYKEDGKEVEGNVVKKIHVACIGILYCGGSNVSKVKFIFDMFSNENFISATDEFKDFLLALFLVPAYCAVLSRKKLSNVNQSVEELETERIQEIIEACELKDSKNLVNVAIKGLFPEEGSSLEYLKFKEKFAKGEGTVGWMITPKGVRKSLEDNNV